MDIRQQNLLSRMAIGTLILHTFMRMRRKLEEPLKMVRKIIHWILIFPRVLLLSSLSYQLSPPEL